MAVAHPYKVLVAEDEFLVADEIVRVLGGLGFEHVGTAKDGKEAIEMTRALQPDVVLMDIKMPGIDGLEATAEIQREQPTAVVLVTAHANQDFIEEAARSGALAFLTKPPRAEEIRRAVTLAVARNRELAAYKSMLQDCARKLSADGGQSSDAPHRQALTVCSYCRLVKHRNGDWVPFESYILSTMGIASSHGICPTCIRLWFPKFSGSS
jgi:DNA-binding NarL/FixJ family response regulator